MKLRNKLYIDFGLFLITAIIITAASLNMVSQFKNKMDEVVRDNYEEVRLANIVRYEISSTSRYLRDLILLDMDIVSIEKDIQNVEDSREKTFLALNDMDELVKSNETSKLVSKLNLLYDSFNDVQIEVETLVKEGRKDEAIELLVNVQKNRDEIYQVINQIVEIEEQVMHDTLEQTENSYRQSIRVFVTLIIFGVLIGLGVMFISMRKIAGDINKVTGVINSITSFDATDNLPRINITANDEIGQIAKAFNEMTGVLEEQIKQAKKYNKAIQEQSWLKSSVGEVSTMFQGVKNIEIFCYELITKITPIVGGKYGVIYMIEGEEEKKYLKKLAAYAFDGSQIDSRDFKLGEGLVGQCALENREIQLEQVPDNYIKITSGLGTASPKNILILPVKFNDQVLGVVEVASLDEFSTNHKEFLHRVLNIMGITINRIANHMQVEKLLKESQIFTEKLQTQSEELQLQQEEL